MKILLFGSTGKVGSIVLQLARQRGLRVVCFDGDVRMKKEVEEFFYLHPHPDAVVSALGSWGTKTQDVVSQGVGNIIPEMKRHGVQKIVSLTGAETRLPSDNPTLSSRVLEIILRIIAPKIYADGQKHLEMLMKSTLKWTVIRSPKMKDGDAMKYHLNEKCPHAWRRVDRRAVACAMLDSLTLNNDIPAPYIHEV